MITDKFGSYAVAGREIMPAVEHRRHKGLNNRAENSHQPMRRRERIMKRFKSPGQLQRFASIHDPIANLFHFPRHALSSSDQRDLRRVATWKPGAKSPTSLLHESRFEWPCRTQSLLTLRCRQCREAAARAKIEDRRVEGLAPATFEAAMGARPGHAPIIARTFHIQNNPFAADCRRFTTGKADAPMLTSLSSFRFGERRPCRETPSSPG
jgi:hypothetical protein